MNNWQSHKNQGPHKSKSLENPRKKLKEGSKEKIWTTYYECQEISTERGVTNHGAFF
jgi:transposase